MVYRPAIVAWQRLCRRFYRECEICPADKLSSTKAREAHQERCAEQKGNRNKHGDATEGRRRKEGGWR